MSKRCIFGFLIPLFLISPFSFAKEEVLNYTNKEIPITLSLNEAILLAVRSNPNVQQTQLTYVLQKFNLWVQEWQFYPHYSLQASVAAGKNTVSGQPINSQNFNVQPGVTLLTPIGMQMSLSSINNSNEHYNPGLSLQVVQPLIRGFGKAIVESALHNAEDSEVIARLSIEAALRNTVTSVINAYLDVLTAERAIKIDSDALNRAQKSIEQTRLYIKAGHKAGNEIITVEANAATARSQLENDKKNLDQARYALLAAIGVDPNTRIKFTTLNLDYLVKKYPAISLDQAKKLILANDIQYQINQIILYGTTERNVLIAEDNARWSLNLTANAAVGNGSGGGQNSGLNSLFNNVNQTRSVSLVLQVPIDDQLSKQAILSAKVALKQAKLALQQEKWSKETSAINGWNSVSSAERTFYFARNAEVLQEKTYNISYQKYLHGLIDSLELQGALVQLIQAQQASLSAQINYLKALVNLDLLSGHTLRTWDIQVRL